MLRCWFIFFRFFKKFFLFFKNVRHLPNANKSRVLQSKCVDLTSSENIEPGRADILADIASTVKLQCSFWVEAGWWRCPWQGRGGALVKNKTNLRKHWCSIQNTCISISSLLPSINVLYQQMLYFACLLSLAAYIFITSVNIFIIFEGLGFRLGCGALSALCTWLLLRVWFLFACFLVLCFFALWLGCAARFSLPP